MKKNRTILKILTVVVLLFTLVEASGMVFAATAATSVSLNKTSVDLTYKKGTVQLKATVKPTGASQTVTWATNNKAVATVSSSGLVQAQGCGVAQISATTANGKRVHCAIVVNPVKVVSPYVVQAFTPVDVGTSKTLKAVFYNEDGNKAGNLNEPTWSTSDSKIATVDSNGKVTFKKAGYVTIGCTVTQRRGDGIGYNAKATTVWYFAATEPTFQLF